VAGREERWLQKGPGRIDGKGSFLAPRGKNQRCCGNSLRVHILQVLERKTEGITSLPEAMKEIEAKLFYEKESCSMPMA
jgi:hypothetical protein